MEYTFGPLLSQINSPDDIKKLEKSQLVQLADEVRQYIIDVVSVNGGHFGASLGVVELTTALHYVLNAPYDKLIWDVGHQAYGHKILTGRKEQFPTNRKKDGICGFPNIFESEYDAFGVGHSSTSISAALGMSVAAKLKGEDDRRVVAVIGDGAMTAGLAFEAMNHAGVSGAKLTIVLNDNNMSIDPNVGALKEYLTDITTSKTYNKLRDEVWNLLGKLPYPQFQQSAASKLEASIKGMVSKSSNLFEALGLRYFGAVDGHNVVKLVDQLNDIVDLPGVKILHIKTVKGKGYSLAEKDQTLWHAPGLFDKTTGIINKPKLEKPQPPKYQDVFGLSIIELAEKNNKVMGITPAMPSGCSLKYMIEKMPDRAIDVGIAEQHAVTFSAGLATQGMRVFCNIYSSFMQRAYDMVIHDVAIQNLPVIFCLDRAGLVGDDGATHQGAYDLAYMRCVPNMVIAAPMNEEELRDMMYTAQLESNTAPFTIRYPRGQGVMVEWKTPFKEMKIGKGVKVCQGDDIAIVSIGHPGNFALEAIRSAEKDGIKCSLYNMRFLKPIDEELLHELAKTHKHIITVEDGTIVGGLGSAVVEFLNENNYNIRVDMMGIPDRIIEHAKPQEQYEECGFDAKSIYKTILKYAAQSNDPTAKVHSETNTASWSQN